MHKNTPTKNNAFTLIELLVVIAIIGILSAIVLAALGSARTNAKEASILSSLNSARTQAELYHVNNGSYSGLCDDEKIQEIVANASSTTGDGAACWEGSISYVEPPQSLNIRDYGVSVKFDDTYYAASPLGASTFDDSDSSTGETWSDAKTLCADAGNRLPSPSELRAMFTISGEGEAPTGGGFAAAAYWSALDSPKSGESYFVHLGTGAVSQVSQGNGNLYVRCVH